MRKSWEERNIEEKLSILQEDIIWGPARKQELKKSLLRSMYKTRNTVKYKRLASYAASLVLFAAMIGVGYQTLYKNAIFESSSTNGVLYEYKDIAGKMTKFLTNEGWEKLYFPANAHQKVSSITGPPSISLSKQNAGITVQAFYPTKNGDQISAHTIFNETDPSIHIEKIRGMYGDKIKELEVEGRWASVYQSKYSPPQLIIVANKFTYYLSGAEEETLIQLAELIDFDKEIYW